MTDQEINTAIAEACGWEIKRIQPEFGHTYWTFKHPDPAHSIKTRYEIDGEVEWPKSLPSYTTDLNAMHEAEKIFKDERFCVCYAENLAIVCIGEELDELNYLEVQTVCHATALQRAEAFLRTLNKWKE